MCLSHLSAVFLWWARLMSGLKRRSRRRIADARLRTGLANVAGSQACPFVPVGIPVRAMSPASATRTAVGLPALPILQLIGDQGVRHFSPLPIKTGIVVPASERRLRPSSRS